MTTAPTENAATAQRRIDEVGHGVDQERSDELSLQLDLPLADAGRCGVSRRACPGSASRRGWPGARDGCSGRLSSSGSRWPGWGSVGQRSSRTPRTGALLEGLSKVVALEVAGRGITSNTVAPGCVRTVVLDPGRRVGRRMTRFNAALEPRTQRKDARS